MFIYSPGAGFSGECRLVKPGDDLVFKTKEETKYVTEEQSDVSQSALSTHMSEVADKHVILSESQGMKKR